MAKPGTPKNEVQRQERALRLARANGVSKKANAPGAKGAYHQMRSGRRAAAFIKKTKQRIVAAKRASRKSGKGGRSDG